jgi:hypothetical protein
MFAKLNKKIFYLIFLLFIFHYFNFFLNVFIIFKNPYDQRMIKSMGFCEMEGYGFVKYVHQKYKVPENIEVRNFSDKFPPIHSYFFDTQKKLEKNYIILINAKREDLIFFSNKGFSIIEDYNNACYFLKKL